MNLRDDVEDMLAATIYFVEANDFETLSLWTQFAKQAADFARFPMERRVDWEEHSRSQVVSVGKLFRERDGEAFPVNVCLTWATLEDELVCFYDSVSPLVDHGMVRKWLEDKMHWLGKPMKHTDAMNFGQVLSALDALEELKQESREADDQFSRRTDEKEISA